MKKKKLFSLLASLIFSMAIFTGCSTSKSVAIPMYGDSAEIKIAVLGSSDQFTRRLDAFIGMDLAIRELAEQNIKVSYEKIDDGHSRDSGIALAKDVANDSKYTMAFTLQNSEVVESIAAIFEEAKKPLLIIDEVFDSTMNKGYEYILAGIVSADTAGHALARYCENNGVKWAAVAHSSSQFENTLARGFVNTLLDSKSTYLVDSVEGPKNASEFAEMYARWNILGVQAAVLSFDDLEWACELISKIKSQNKDILILGDAKYNDTEKLTKYKDVMEGMVVAASSGVAVEDHLQAFYSKYTQTVRDEHDLLITSIMGQVYDFVHMITQNVRKSNNVEEFMKNMKSSEGYAGATGVKFNSKGQLDEEPAYWIVRDAQMYRLS